MRQKIGRIILILLCLTGLIGFVYLDNIDKVENSEMELSFYLGDEIIYAWEGEEAYYLFLPSYAGLGDVRLTPFSTGFEVVSTGERIERSSTLSSLSYNEIYSCKSFSTKESFGFCIMKSENLPAVFMETDSGTVEHIWADKEIEENGKIRLFSKQGEFLYKGGLNSVKARGNYSFSHYDKKPFSITLKEEVSLLGLGIGQKYVLLSNASDPALIRNDIARRLEAALETEYDNIGRFVDLYVNGEYLGNYYLCESIEVGYDRINITNLEEQMDLLYQKSNYESFEIYETDTAHAEYMGQIPFDITGGYLVEREFEDRYRLEYGENPSGFITQGEEHFIVKSPRYCSSEQIEYLQEYFNEAEAAILSEDGINAVTKKSYEEYIDVESFVKKYLVEEITKNYDAGISSMFFYKDADVVDGRIKAAPIWDCDMSLGCYLDWMEFFSKDPTGVTRLSLHPHASPWYDALYQKEEYYQKVREYYVDKAVPFLNHLTESFLDEYEQGLAASATMNEIRWANDLANNLYYEDRNTEFEQLKDFIVQRKEFLDEAWIEEKTYYIVTFEKDEVIRAIQYPEENAVLTKLPELEDEDFTGWNYNGEKITGDTVITCK